MLLWTMFIHGIIFNTVFDGIWYQIDSFWNNNFCGYNGIKNTGHVLIEDLSLFMS